MHIVSRRNMLALPVERLVGNNHHHNNNHHHSRLSLSPDSNISDSSSSAGESLHSIHTANRHQHEGMSDTIATSSMMMSPMSPPRGGDNSSSSGRDNYSLANHNSNSKMHILMKRNAGKINPKISPPLNSNSTPPPTPSSPCSGDEEECIDIVGGNNNDEERVPVPLDCHNRSVNSNRNQDPYYRHNLSTSTSTSTRDRSRSPKIKNSISNRTCSTSVQVTGAGGEMVIIKSEVDMDDRLSKKEPLSMSTSVQAVNALRAIHSSYEDNNNDITTKERRSDKFNTEDTNKMKSANFNNTTTNANSNNNSSRSRSRQYDEDDDDNTSTEDMELKDNRVRVTSTSRRTSGPSRDHRVDVEDNNEDDNETNNSSVDDNNVNNCNNNEDDHRHNNHYHRSDNSRPPSSTSSQSFNLKPHNLKFSIEDILRPDFGHNKVLNRQPQIFNPFLISPSPSSEGNRYNHHHHQSDQPRWNNSKELLSPSSHTGSISSSSKTHNRNGSVSSTDGHRPYRPSSVHCHSEDSNNSCTSRTREEVVDDTKVNPPVPKGPLLWPAWVYCTRYSDRPSSGPRSRRIRKSPREVPEEKRPRTAFTAEQLARLKQEFEENRYLTEKRRQDLANDLKLHENQIKIWFQNKRAKLKKSTGTKNGLALQLMAQGLYNHSTVPIDEDEEMMDML